MDNNTKATPLKDNYLNIKLVTVIGVCFVFFLASLFLSFTIDSRKNLSLQAKKDIALSWSGPQTIIGPVLIVPYTLHKKKDDKDNDDKLGNMVLLPDTLNFKGSVDPEVRHRGIFDLLVYQADLKVECSFQPNKLSSTNKDLHWDKAKVVIWLDDARGFNKVDLKVNNQEVLVQSGSACLNNTDGVHAQVNLTNKSAPIHLDLHMNIKGSDSLNLLPCAKENTIKIVSPWCDPSFIGKFLPNSRSITKQGFEAQWTVSSLASSLPEYYDIDAKNKFSDKALGIRFFKVADHYQQAERTSKYSILFILYTFLVFFLYEAVKKTKIHIFQYCITACSLLGFSTLLTAIAEHTPFEIAYAISSLAVITQISFYIFSILHKPKDRLLFVSLLIVLYAYLFIVLRLEEIAFLFGAFGMFIAITVVMYCTKNVKWFGDPNNQQS